MIPYIGLPILGEESVCLKAIKGGHAFLSFSAPVQSKLAVAYCQSYALDNGAYSAWKKGQPITDWKPFYEWVESMRYPGLDFVIIPDQIGGTETDNDRLIDECPLPLGMGCPLWHMTESLERLNRLTQFPRVAIGGLAQYNGGRPFWDRMNQAMEIICDKEGRPRTKIHGLRMLAPQFTCLPLSSADSTNLARNVSIDKNWKNGRFSPMTKECRATVLRDRVEAQIYPCTYTKPEIQDGLFSDGINRDKLKI
jgi:hypothetical protein